MKSIKRVLFVLFTVFFSLLVACEGSQEEREDFSATYPVSYRISTRVAADMNATDAEQMHDLQLYIVNAGGKIEAIITKTFNAPTVGTEYEEIVQLTAGKKLIYGFANLTERMKTDAGLNIAAVGGEMPASANDATCVLNNGAMENTFIPMSNKTEITVAHTAGQTFEMELIRLMCKVRLTFSNETGMPIQFKTIQFGPVTNGSVYLLPHTNASDKLELPSVSNKNWFDVTVPTTELSVNGIAELPAFYVNESIVDNDGWFQIKLNTDVDQKQQIRLALTQLSALNRNDYLSLPIVLTDYKLELSVKSYPPIGGYPASVVRNEDDYYCTFSGGGPFIITPKLTYHSTGANVTEKVEWKMECESNVALFDKQPIFKNGVIEGTLKPAVSGKALCVATATVTSKEGVSRSLFYKIYIQQ